MTFKESLKNLPTSRELRQNAETMDEQMQQLRQMIEQISSELRSLPTAVATETSQALSSIETLRQTISNMGSQIDKLATVQRAATDALTDTLAEAAGPLLQQAADPLTNAINRMNTALGEIEKSSNNLTENLNDIVQLPDKIEGQAENLQTAALRVMPKWWKWLGALMLAGVMGGLVAGAGMEIGRAALNRLVPPSDVQQAADWANTIWSKATPKERELLKQIVNRPAN